MEELPRPAPVRSVADRVSDWVGWFGLGRLLSAAAAVAVVGAGAFWLTRAPQPPTEQLLPRATTASTTLAAAGPAGSPTATPMGAGGPVTVHVTGAVARPGVYDLPAGSRVRDAVERAGGATAEGDPNSINLAAVIGDGARIYIPRVGEPVTVEAAGGAAPSGPLDVNRASVDELQQLPGVGPATAAAIVRERDQNGPFLGVDDLQRVPGIGPVKLEALRELVTT